MKSLLTSRSSIIGAVRTLVEKVKYFARCSYLIEIRTASVAPVGTFRTLCREKFVLNLEVFCYLYHQSELLRPREDRPEARSNCCLYQHQNYRNFRELEELITLPGL